jgi:hypothetical protein
MEVNYTLIILGTILVIIIYILYYSIKNKGVSVTKKIYLNETNSDVPMNTLVNPLSQNYFYSLWVYVNVLSAESTLFTIEKTSASNTFFKLYITSDSKLKYGITTTDGGSSVLQINNEIMTNFPLQKWVYIIVSVDNKVADLYIDGKLVRSQNLNDPKPPAKDSTIKYPTRIDAYISKFERQAVPMNPATAWSNYMAGNGGNYLNSLISSYGMNVTLTKDDIDYNQFKLF